MDDLRAAVASVLALTREVRLVAIDAAGLVDGGELAVYAAVAGAASDAPRSVVADPLRLPFVAAIADAVVARIGPDGEPQARLREMWRILAPAGVLVLVVPLPPGMSVGRLIARRMMRRRIAVWLAAALFEADRWQTVAGTIVVRAGKRDGLAPRQRQTARVHAAARA